MSIDHYAAVIADLETRRDQLIATIESLRQVQAMRSGSPMPPPPIGGVSTSARPSIQADAEFASDAFFGKSIPEAAKQFLSAVKRPKSNGEVCAALQAGGLTSASKNFGENVRSILTRNSEFVKVNGEWGLAEWYPGYRGKKPRKPSDAANTESDAPVEEVMQPRLVVGEETPDAA